MFLREFFYKPKINVILEGGNKEIDNPNFDPSKPESPDNPKKLQAQEIKLASTKISDEVQDRTHMVGVLKKLFLDINQKFTATYKKPLFDNKLLNSEIQEFMAGSSKHFFNLLRPNPNFNPSQPESAQNPKMIGISDEEFKKYKPLVGDIDIQCNQEMKEELLEFLNSNVGIPIGGITLLEAPSQGNEQYNTVWQIIDPPLRIQIDFEYGRYAPETGKPDEWTSFSHSSAWEDIVEGIKGVFHKYIYRALTKAVPTKKYIAKLDGRGKNRIMTLFGGPEGKDKITDVNTYNPKVPIQTDILPTTDTDLSFAVASAGGGGLRDKYRPVNPTYNLPTEINGIPVMEPVSSDEGEYEQDLNQQFSKFFKSAPQQDDRKNQESFVGTLKLMDTYLNDDAKRKAAEDFITIVFEPGAQMITKDDPERDLDIKFKAVNKMLEVLNLPDLQKKADSMSELYKNDYYDLEAFKKKYDAENPNPVNDKGQPKKPQYGKERSNAIAAGTWKPLANTQSMTEEVAASPRQGIDHLSKMKDIEFIEFAKSIQQDLKGKIDAIPVTLKVDGLGARFGKSTDGTPFFESSSSGPIFKPGSFSAFAQKAGHDNVRLQRAKHYDELFDLITNSSFVKKLPNDTKVFCEILYNPMAEATDSGLTFVTINYDKKLLGNTLSIVPHYVEYTNNTPHPQSQKIKEWLLTQSTPEIKFIDDRLDYEESLDVSATIDPVLSLNDQAIATLKSLKLADKEEKAKIKASIQAVKNALANQILNNPRLVDKYKLGQDIEGVILQRPNAPRLKITTKDFQQSKSAEKNIKEDIDTNGVAIIFGRFNPPHKGHKEAWRTASNYQDWLVGTHQETEGPDDPLPFDIKIEAMKAIAAANPSIPDFENHLLATNSWRHLARQMYLRQLAKEGKTEGEQVSVSLVVCTDENDKESYLRMVGSGNGQPNKMGNVPYNFTSVEWQPTPRLSSATDLRNAVKNGDRARFAQAAGISANTPVAGMKFFDLVAKYLMPYKEKHDEKERLKKERESEKAAKLAKKSATKSTPIDATPISESYENIMSTLIERIIKNELRRS